MHSTIHVVAEGNEAGVRQTLVCGWLNTGEYYTQKHYNCSNKDYLSLPLSLPYLNSAKTYSYVYLWTFKYTSACSLYMYMYMCMHVADPPLTLEAI